MVAPAFHEDWYSAEQLDALCALALRAKTHPGAALEIGAWEGRSTFPLAVALAPTILHVVDTWQGSAFDHTDELAASRDVYAQFKQNLDAYGLTNLLVWKMTDLAYLGGHCPNDLVFVHLDGPHDEASVRLEIAGTWPRLVSGGIIAGDDWPWPDVQRAVQGELGAVAVGPHRLWWKEKP